MFRYLEWQFYPEWHWLPWFSSISDTIQVDYNDWAEWETWYFGWGFWQFRWNYRNWEVYDH